MANMGEYSYLCLMNSIHTYRAVPISGGAAEPPDVATRDYNHVVNNPRL